MLIFEKGGKSISSRDVSPVLQGSGWHVCFNETLAMVVTLYRESSGKYQVSFKRKRIHFCRILEIVLHVFLGKKGEVDSEVQEEGSTNWLRLFVYQRPSSWR